MSRVETQIKRIAGCTSICTTARHGFSGGQSELTGLRKHGLGRTFELQHQTIIEIFLQTLECKNFCVLGVVLWLGERSSCPRPAGCLYIVTDRD
eukprot:scaffold331029_cov28-Prasinocladus_malaysianus.AAC.1